MKTREIRHKYIDFGARAVCVQVGGHVDIHVYIHVDVHVAAHLPNLDEVWATFGHFA